MEVRESRASDKKMRSQVDGEYLVPFLGAGCRQTASSANAHVEHNAIDGAKIAKRVCHQTLAILFAAHVSDDHARRAAFLHDLMASFVGREFVFVSARHPSAFARAKQRNGSPIADGRGGFVARL